MDGIRRIILLTSSETAEQRGLLRGIYRFARPGRPWMLETRGGQRPSVVPGLIALRPDGVIAHTGDAELVAALADAPLPVVLAGADPPPGRAALGVDQREVGAVAARHLLSLGLRSFAFLGLTPAPQAHPRLDGFASALAASGRSCERLLLSSTFSLHANPAKAAHLRDWLAGLPRPCGLFAWHDAFAHLVADTCLHAGIRIPEEIALIGADDDDLICLLAHPPLSSVRLPWEQVGFEAAALLERLMEGERPPRATLLVEIPGVTRRRSTDHLAQPDPVVEAALRYLHENAGRPLAMATVAHHAGVSERTLELRFQSALHRSPSAELCRLRIEKAKALLAETDLLVRQVARHSGFSDAKWFSARFRALAGVTPTVYRARYR